MKPGLVPVGIYSTHSCLAHPHCTYSTHTHTRTHPVQVSTQWKAIATKSLNRLEQERALHEQDIALQQLNSAEEDQTGIKRVRIKDQQRPTFIPIESSSPTHELSAYLSEGDSHRVWRPKKAPQLASLVSDLIKKEKANVTKAAQGAKLSTPVDKPLRVPSAAKLATPGDTSPAAFPQGAKSHLRSRQKSLFRRINATQAVLKETTDELLNAESQTEEGMNGKPRISLFDASKKITSNIRHQRSLEKQDDDLSSIVSKYLETMKAESTKSSTGGDKKSNPRRTIKTTPRVIELAKYKELVQERHKDGKKATKRAVSQYPLSSLPAIEETSPSQSKKHKPVDRCTSDSAVVGLGPKSARKLSPRRTPDRDSESPESSENVSIGKSRNIPDPLQRSSPADTNIAKLKEQEAKGRRGTAMNRQNPVDFEISLSTAPPVSPKEKDNHFNVTAFKPSATVSPGDPVSATDVHKPKKKVRLQPKDSHEDKDSTQKKLSLTML